MAKTEEVLELLRFELQFLEDGGYGRSPHSPTRPSLIFEDSPTCLNFDDATRPHPCGDCFLMQFVPKDQCQRSIPCRHIPLTGKGETIDDFYRNGTQVGLEDALKQWLRATIADLERKSAGPTHRFK